MPVIPDAQLSEQPTIHPTSILKSCHLGAWTDVGHYGHFLEVSMDDYSCTAGHSEIAYTEMGKFCSIASYVRINPGNHPQWRVTQHHCTDRRKQYGFDTTDDDAFFDWRRAHACKIGNDVWLGHNVTIMPGVSIGDGAIIGTVAVVTKDVGAYEVAVGVLAKIIKKRFPDAVIAQLLQIKWWDWSRAQLEARFHELNDLDAFLARYGDNIE